MQGPLREPAARVFGRGMGAVLVGFVLAGSASGQDWSALENRTLSLGECLDLARRNNPSLARSATGIRTAQAGVMQAWSGVLPRVQNYSNYYGFDADRYYLTGVALEKSRVRYSNFLSVEQTLFAGFGNVARIAGARAARRTAESDYRNARQELDLGVREAYLGLLKAKALLDVRQETVDLSEQHVTRAEAFYRAGEKTQADVLRARVERSQNELELITARNAVNTARATLAHTLGVPVDLELDVADLAEPDLAAAPDLTVDVGEATANHPQLRGRAAAVESAEAGVRDAKSGRWPSLAGAWEYQWNDYDLPRFSGDEHRWGSHDEWWVRLTMSFTVFDGRLTKSGIRRAEAQRDYAGEDYRQVVSDVVLGVKQAHLDLAEARERIRAAEETVSLAEEDRRLQEERYRLGEGTLLELNDSLVALTHARVSRITALYDYHLATARLDRAVGRDG
jgi:outer membrane protein